VDRTKSRTINQGKTLGWREGKLSNMHQSCWNHFQGFIQHALKLVSIYLKEESWGNQRILLFQEEKIIAKRRIILTFESIISWKIIIK
jgi:hypothetical protein